MNEKFTQPSVWAAVLLAWKSWSTSQTPLDPTEPPDPGSVLKPCGVWVRSQEPSAVREGEMVHHVVRVKAGSDGPMPIDACR
jgi:hypothetical protein